MQNKILDLFKVYEEEVGILLWTAALLFIVRSSGIILNNYAETAFLKRYGVEYLPVVNMANAVVTMVITGFLATMLSKLSGAQLLSRIFAFSGILVAIIRLLIPYGHDILYPLLFMLKSQFELLQAMFFWNMCNDLFNTRQSKRLFPLLTAGGIIGLILGSLGTPYFARMFTLDNLLYLYLATTFTGMFIVQAMERSYPTLVFQEKPQDEFTQKPSMLEEIKNVYPLIKDSVLVKIVLVLTFMPNVVVPIMNYQFNYAVNDQFASEAKMIEFFGYFRGGLYTISLFLLLFVGRIYGRWGLPVALLFHPFNYMLAFFAFLFRFDVFSAMYAKMSTNILRTTINVPANGILIGLFPETYRNMVRPFLRGTVVRIALFTGSTLILISDNFFHPRYLTLVALPFVLAWIAAPIFLKAKYSSILKGLISRDLLDLKSFDQQELNQVFKQDKVIADLTASFEKASGENAVWYAKLIKNLAPQVLDEKILATYAHRDEATQIALIKMISQGSRPEAARTLIRQLDPKRPEAVIAVLKLVSQDEFRAVRGKDLTPFIQSKNPVVRGFAMACHYHRDAAADRPVVRKWLHSDDQDFRQSGIICAGLSREPEYIQQLLAILDEDNIAPLIPDIIIALSRLKAKELNHILFSYLSHDLKPVRLAALDALEINSDMSLQRAIHLLADSSDTIREFAKEKIQQSQYRNNKLLVQSLGLPSSRIRKAIFDILETLDIKEFDILVFTKAQIQKCYDCLAMYENLKGLGNTPAILMVRDHLLEKKERILDNIIRVLAIHDKSGTLITAWRGIFSVDTRQRANAIELLSNAVDKKTFNAMAPLLESPSPETALAEGQHLVKPLKLDRDGRQTTANLLDSEDWVDIIMGLNLPIVGSDAKACDTLCRHFKGHENPHIQKEARMILKKNAAKKNDTDGQIKSTDIPMGEKILLLKEIDIFSGLSAEELAAIATVTKELGYPGDKNVIRQGEMGETVFLIIDGKVAVIREQEDGSSIVLDQMESGAAFGEMALIDDAPRSATIKTLTPCRFLILHKQEFKETAMEFPRIALGICSVLSQRIRDLHSKFS